MDIKHAIHCQKVYTDETVCEECELYFECTHETQADIARLAINALEKQIPQKTILNFEDDREYEDYICPNCKDILQQRRKGATAITIYKFKHCHHCGQALDWGENSKD